MTAIDCEEDPSDIKLIAAERAALACKRFQRWLKANPPANLPQPRMIKPDRPAPRQAQGKQQDKATKTQTGRGKGRQSGLLDQVRQYLFATNAPATLGTIAKSLGFDAATKRLLERTLHNAAYKKRGIVKAGYAARSGTRPVVLWAAIEWESHQRNQ